MVKATVTGTDDAAVTLHAQMTDILREATGLSEHLASAFAEALVVVMRARLGGQELYVPIADRDARDRAIREQFNGRNRDEMCRKYRISRSRLYQIVAQTNPVFSGKTRQNIG